MINRIENEGLLRELNKAFPSRKFDFSATIGPIEVIGIIESNNSMRFWIPDQFESLSKTVEKYLIAEGFNDVNLLKQTESVEVE